MKNKFIWRVAALVAFVVMLVVNSIAASHDATRRMEHG